LLFLLTGVCLAEKQNYQYYSLWFDPTRARANVQPHSRQACLQLQNYNPNPKTIEQDFIKYEKKSLGMRKGR
jgi:hypothetical protein